MKTLVLPASAREGVGPEAWVEVINASGHRRVPVPADGLHVARAPDQHIVLDAPTVSKHHAELFWRGDDPFVQVDGYFRLRATTRRYSYRYSAAPLGEPVLERVA